MSSLITLQAMGVNACVYVYVCLSMCVYVYNKYVFMCVSVNISSSSSCRAASTDFPDSLTPFVCIIHRFRQVH